MAPISIENAAGVITIVVNTGGGGSTVSAAGALLIPEAEAVMCTVPAATPIAVLPFTIAIELALSDDQVKVIPLIALLNWSYPTAV